MGKWRSRFVAQRLEGLYDEPRPGVERTITDDQIEEVVTKTLETTPKGRTHWSTRSYGQASWAESFDDRPYLANVRTSTLIDLKTRRVEIAGISPTANG